MTQDVCANAIADCVLNEFNALPPKFKPRKLANGGGSEWVTLAGIVLSRSSDPKTTGRQAQTPVDSPDHSKQDQLRDDAGLQRDRKLFCAALATGVKCVPRDKVIKAQGNILHDSHAEVLAIRAFNRCLIDECGELARKGLEGQHAWLRWTRAARRGEDEGYQNEESSRGEVVGIGRINNSSAADEQPNVEDRLAMPFELHEDVKLHMYISEAPCGDASMELTMAEQEDPSPWTSPLPSSASSTSLPFATTYDPDPTSSPSALLGRGHFDQLGIVRRKPARPDAPLSWSKSCSDKLAMKQCTSLLSGLTSHLVRPWDVYLSTLVLPRSQLVPAACERAFGCGGGGDGAAATVTKGRMAALLGGDMQERWLRLGHRFSRFDVKATDREFEFSRRMAGAKGSSQSPSATLASNPSNLSAVAMAGGQREVLINGVLQGRKQTDPRGASRISRRQMWTTFLEVAVAIDLPTLDAKLSKAGSYGDAKRSEDREVVKQDAITLALGGWNRRRDDEHWSLDDDTKSNERWK